MELEPGGLVFEKRRLRLSGYKDRTGDLDVLAVNGASQSLGKEVCVSKVWMLLGSNQTIETSLCRKFSFQISLFLSLMFLNRNCASGHR